MRKLPINKLVSFAGLTALLSAALFPALASAGAYTGTNGKMAFGSSTGVQVINSDGSGAVTIPGTNNLSGNARISPDGKKVVWSQYTGSTLANTPSTIQEANADGTGSITNITSGSGNRDDAATWSPDGKWLLFVRDWQFANNRYGGHIMITSSTGTNTALFINAVTCTGVSTPTNGWEEPSWSPDGSRVALINRCDDTNGGVYTFGISYTAGSSTEPTWDLATSHQISNDNDAGPPIVTDYWPSWSPDGSHIIFTRTGANYEVEEATDTALGTITPLFTTAPGDLIIMSAFSPDGTQIVFDSRVSGTAGLYTMAAAGGTATIVPNTTTANSADWAPTVVVTPPAGNGTVTTPAPSAPNTGLAAMVASPVSVLVSSAAVAFVIVLVARRMKSLKA